MLTGERNNYYKLEPDLTMLGKIIGGGLPMAAYGGRAEIMKKVAPVGPIYQAGTLAGNPVAVTAGIAMLQYLEAHPEVYATMESRTAQLTADLPVQRLCEPGGFDAHAVLSIRTGEELRRSKTFRHRAVRQILPLPAGTRRLFPSLTVRSGFCIGRPYAGRHSVHEKRCR